jgi:hypothetical protein
MAQLLGRTWGRRGVTPTLGVRARSHEQVWSGQATLAHVLGATAIRASGSV